MCEGQIFQVHWQFGRGGKVNIDGSRRSNRGNYEMSSDMLQANRRKGKNFASYFQMIDFWFALFLMLFLLCCRWESSNLLILFVVEMPQGAIMY